MAMGGSDPMRHQSQMEQFSLPGGDLKEVLNYINVGDLLFMLSLAEGILVTSVQALTTALAIVVGNIGRFSDFLHQDQNGGLATLETLKLLEQS